MASKPMKEQSKYIDIVNRIDVAYKEMKKLRPLSESELSYFVKEFSISFSHDSNAIEGNTFSYDETKFLIEKGIAIGGHTLRENQDIVGHKQGYDYMYDTIKKNGEITEEFIKKIHSYVCIGEEFAGKYRNIQIYIGDGLNTAFKPCGPEFVAEEMERYTEGLRRDILENREKMKKEPVEWESLFHNLAKHHIEFEKIHPFQDGNGRTGRLLLSAEMIGYGLLPVSIRYEHRDRYYAALKTYDDKQKYSTRAESATEGMAKLLAETELNSMAMWLEIYKNASQ